MVQTRMEAQRSNGTEQLLQQLVTALQPRPPPPPRPRLSAGDDVESFLKTFERTERLMEVPEARWSVDLGPCLTGQALDAYAKMPLEDVHSYQRVKAAILREYHRSPEKYRVAFRSAEPQQGETHYAFIQRLKTLSQRWLGPELIPGGVLKKIVAEQFLAAIPSNVSVEIKKIGVPDDLELLAQAAERISEVTKITHSTSISTTTERVCYTCGEKGHFSKFCPRHNSSNKDNSKKDKPVFSIQEGLDCSSNLPNEKMGNENEQYL